MIHDTYAEYQENQIDQLIYEYMDYLDMFRLGNNRISLERWFGTLKRCHEPLPEHTKEILRDYVDEYGEKQE